MDARGIFAHTAQCRLALREEEWVGISAAAKLFVVHALERNPAHRPTMAEVEASPWLASARSDRAGVEARSLEDRDEDHDVCPELPNARARLSCLATAQSLARRDRSRSLADSGAPAGSAGHRAAREAQPEQCHARPAR